MRFSLTSAVFVVIACLCLPATFASERCMVIIDQDGSGPGGSNQMTMMALLQAAAVQVAGITIVTGNAWRDEAVQHSLRMLELIRRSDVPVRSGSVWDIVAVGSDSSPQDHQSVTDPSSAS